MKRDVDNLRKERGIILLIDYDNYQGWKDVIPFYKNVHKEGITLWQAA